MKNTVYRKILSITMLIGGLLGVIILQTFLLSLMAFITKQDIKSAANMIVYCMAYSVICIAVVLVLRYLMQRFLLIQPVPCKKGAIFDRKITIPGLIVLGISLQALCTGLLNIAYIFAHDTEVFRNYNEIIKSIDGSMTKSILIYTLFLAPIVEELMFRGLFMDFSRYGFSVTASIIITAVCFGVFHGNIIQCCYAVPLGIMLGYVRMCRDRMSDPIILHIVINISGAVVVPVLVGAISQAAGKMVSYGFIAILGMILLAMWFLKGKESDGYKADF